MAVYADRSCAWCKAVLAVDAKGDGKFLELRDSVTYEGKVYCPPCYTKLQSMTEFVKGRKGRESK